MEMFIALAADGFKKGDRIIAKTGRGEYHLATVKSSGAKVGLVFDDGLTATVGPEDFKDMTVLDPKTKKNKNALTRQEMKDIVAASKGKEKYVSPKEAVYGKKKSSTKKVEIEIKPKKAKVKQPTKVPPNKPAPKKAKVEKPERPAPLTPPKVKPVSAAGGDLAAQIAKLPTDHPKVGWVISGVPGSANNQLVVLEAKQGTKLWDIKLYDIARKQSMYWKIRFAARTSRKYGDMFGLNQLELSAPRFKYVRPATPDEMAAGKEKRQKIEDFYDKRREDNHANWEKLNIKPGDKVMVNYTNGARTELVTDINYKEAKIAIYSPGREARGMKRRFINMKHVTEVVERGPGYYK